MGKKSLGIISFLLLIALVVGVTACGNEEEAATTADKCAFVVGNGQEGENAKIHTVSWAGQRIHVGDKEDARYFPCNSRTYIINNGKVKNANRETVGDRFNLSVGYTKQHTKVLVGVSAYWTLNETKSVLEQEFAPLCFKFTCYSDNTESGNADFSTKGWNGMLGEVFGSSVDQTMLQVTPNIEDSIWESHNVQEYKRLANELSAHFAENVQATTGYTNDLFCGSGNSGWSNSSSPGQGKFACSKVRFVVNSVENASSEQQNLSDSTSALESQEQANHDALEIAKAKYGGQAQFWLGVQDSIRDCPEHTTCVVNVGESKSVTR